MKAKHKVVLGSLMLLICGYFLWTQRPVTIIRAGNQIEYDPLFLHGLDGGIKPVSSESDFYFIVVDHFPLTEWGRIHWYWKHKNELKEKYHIPTSVSYNITFWDIGNGFTSIQKSGDSDLHCFPPRENEKEHCLEKNWLLNVEFDAGDYERFSFDDSEYYWITMPDGKLVRIKRA